MRSDKLVVNASPIISLAKIGSANFLPALSSRFIVPNGVYEEIVRYSFSDPATEWLRSQKSEIVVSVEVPSIISDWNLGNGETQVIAYAIQNIESLQRCWMTERQRIARRSLTSMFAGLSR
jgi:predicted nucleic acid-binding protein